MELVGCAKDAAEAVELARETEFDVAVLDWMMPGGGGAKATEDIKAQCPDAAIIALTAMDATQASYEMLSAGAVAFLEKGCPPEELVATIRNAASY